MNTVLLALLLLTFSVLPSKSQNRNDEEILSLIRTMEIAWGSKNAELFSQNFCAEHDYIVWNGMYSPGITVEANKNGHNILFTELEEKNSKIKYVVDKILYLSENIALINILGSTYPKNAKPSPYPTQIQTWILINENDSWKIKSMHSTDIEYDIFIHENACPEIPSTEEQKTTYAREFYKSYYSSLNP